LHASVKEMNRDQVVNRIKEQAVRHGGVFALARAWEVSNGYLNDVIFYRRTPGPKILKAMGLKKVIKPTLYVEDV